MSEIHIHDGRGWSQHDRKRCAYIALAQSTIEAALAGDLLRWDETPDGVQAYVNGAPLPFVSWADLAAREGAIDHGRWHQGEVP